MKAKIDYDDHSHSIDNMFSIDYSENTPYIVERVYHYETH